MKKILWILLTISLLSVMTGCGGDSLKEPAETEAFIQPSEESTEMETETTESGPEPEGVLYLNVSSIDLSLVGDQEDLYAGSLPREVITWESEDPSVCTFENGILTAVGVGSTAVSARFEDQYLKVPVSCLAETQEDLDALSPAILQQPKRLPPASPEEMTVCFQDAVLVGDSISYILFQNEMRSNGLGDASFLVRGGISINSLVKGYLKLNLKGQNGDVEDLIAQLGVSKVFIMLGQNDLGYMTLEDTMENLKTMVNRIRQESPNIEIYLESCIPEYQQNNIPLQKNVLLDDYNKAMLDYAAENGFHYVNVEKYIENHHNNMARDYHMDELHMKEEGCNVWMDVLKAHMYMEQLQFEAVH